MANDTNSERMLQKWFQDNVHPLVIPAHGSSVVTCVVISHNRLITASDGHDIHVYSLITGELQFRLEGCEGAVWSLAVAPNSTDVLISGSTDCMIRVWDLITGKCTHVFGGHTSTVRCLVIAKPAWMDINGRREKWPKRSLIVSGSRDHTLRVWKLPKKGAGTSDTLDFSNSENHNPHHLRVLAGHTHVVRSLAVHGRMAVSASYDTTVKVWDIITGWCIWTLQGHGQKVYSVVFDHERNQVISGAMDGAIRVWSLATGQTIRVLNDHTSLVEQLSLSSSYLVSSSVDGNLLVYDPSSGTMKHKLAMHTGAITCFQADNYKIVSGGDVELILWDIREGKIIRKMLAGETGVWRVAFEGRWCVAAFSRSEETYLAVWDFGGDGEENTEDDQIEVGEEADSEDERD